MSLRPLIAAALLLATPVLAQPKPPAASPPAAPAMPMLETVVPPSPPTLQAFVARPANRDALAAAARSQFATIPGACAAATFTPTGEVTVYEAPAFNAAGAPVAGLWSEKVAAAGCGPTRTLNVLTVARPDAEPNRIPMMPGSTHSDPVTQRSALQYAQAIASRASPPDCRQQSFVDTVFDGYQGLPNPEVKDGRDSRAWTEDWILFACGTVYKVGLQFRPNAQGTQLAGTNPVKIGGPAAPQAPTPPAPAARR